MGRPGWASWVVASILAASIAVSAEPIRGVNLGGWFVTEEWITPDLYQGLANDEWDLCNVLGKQDCLSALRQHWSTFYTYSDFQDIKQAGLNSVRIPVGYWAVDLADYEPYVQGQYPYLIRAVQWAQQLGLTVLIDLHGAPGSQNGQDNSGLIGPVLFPANTSNADRSLTVLRNLTIEFSQSQYGGVVRGIELLNEPRLGSAWNMSGLKAFYGLGGQAVQSAASVPINTTFHDAFWGPQYWSGYTLNATLTSLSLDTHQYYAFAPHNNLPHDVILESICNVSGLLKQPQQESQIPYTIVGEWSLESGTAPNASSASQNKGDTVSKRTWLRLLFEAQFAAYTPNGPGQASIGWYFWTWKTTYDIDTWSYRRGLAEQYIPSDVGNASTFVFPLLSSGCVDSSFNYTAPSLPGDNSPYGPYFGAASHRYEVSAVLLSALYMSVLVVSVA